MSLFLSSFTLPAFLQNAVAALLRAVQANPPAALLCTLAAFALLLVVTMTLVVHLALLSRRQKRILAGMGGADVPAMLLAHMEGMEQLAGRVERAARFGESNAASLRECMQRVGVVRYDAFADLGGRQSFSVALLDADENGIVLTGLSARHETRVYAKPVAGGVSAGPIPLTPEEAQAVDGARAGGPGSAERESVGVGEPLPGTAREKWTAAAVSAGILAPRPVPLHSGDRFEAALRNGN